ncbi:MAG: PAS-domain containing protein [Paracoccaceae bacterium]
MMNPLLNPSDTLERQNEKLLKITEALMRRVEQDTDTSGAAYAQFERAALLEDQVRQRTSDLERVLDLLNDSNARLAKANRATEAARSDLTSAIEAVEEGFALFSSDDLLSLSNSRFSMHLGDLKAILKPGLTFSEYVLAVSQSPSLDMPDQNAREAWRILRMQRHKDAHSIFNVHLTGDRWVQVSEHRTPDGGTVILQTDVTDIMRLERDAREKLVDDQAIMIRATLDHLNQGVGIFDSETRLVGWNARLGRLLAVSASQIRFGAHFDTLFERMRSTISLPDEMPAGDVLAWVAAKTRRRPIQFEIRHANGATLDFFAQEMPDRGFVVSITDITAERDAARRLAEANEHLEQRVVERTLELEDALADAERANASKSRFVAAASHDLLQPLSAAKLYVALMGENDRNPAELETVRKAMGALESVENIIEALLDISKLDAGTTALEQTAVPLGKVLARLRDEFAPHAALKGLDFRIIDTNAVVYSNPLFLSRILQNLIGNALRYTEKGRVLVGVRRNGGTYRLEVWDTGPGIAEEHQDVIFQEFHRLDATKSATEGLGLGLAIVERACHRLGHPLGLWSELGKGTGFFVNLEPAEAGKLPLQAPPAPRQRRKLAESGMIVLLVENDSEVRRAISLLLGKWNASVLDVANGAEAMALLKEIQIKPDAMLIDYQLDNGEIGLDLVHRLRELYGPIPARIISANRTAELRQKCIETGVELMSKPLDARTLEHFLTNAIPES